MAMRLHKVAITLKRNGGSSVALNKTELERLVNDWKGYRTEITDYKGFLWLGFGEFDKKSSYTICLRPSHIIEIMVDGVVVTYD